MEFPHLLLIKRKSCKRFVKEWCNLEDILDNLKTIKDIPLKINSNDVPNLIEIDVKYL